LYFLIKYAEKTSKKPPKDRKSAEKKSKIKVKERKGITISHIANNIVEMLQEVSKLECLSSYLKLH